MADKADERFASTPTPESKASLELLFQRRQDDDGRRIHEEEFNQYAVNNFNAFFKNKGHKKRND